MIRFQANSPAVLLPTAGFGRHGKDTPPSIAGCDSTDAMKSPFRCPLASSSFVEMLNDERDHRRSIGGATAGELTEFTLSKFHKRRRPTKTNENAYQPHADRSRGETHQPSAPFRVSEEWQRALIYCSVKEKALTRAGDALAAERRRLPMVRIEKDYVFDGSHGKVPFLNLFEGRRQLIIYHFMFLRLASRVGRRRGAPWLFDGRGLPWPPRTPPRPRHFTRADLSRAP